MMVWNRGVIWLKDSPQSKTAQMAIFVPAPARAEAY
jgi:hypothetical protein